MTQSNDPNSEEKKNEQNQQPSHAPEGDLDRDQDKDDYDEELEAKKLLKEEQKAARARQYTVYRKTQQTIYLLVAMLQVLLGLRFILRLFPANQESLFASVIFRISEPFAYPFSNLFNNPSFNNDTIIFDINLLFGMIIYLLLMFLVNCLLRIIIIP